MIEIHQDPVPLEAWEDGSIRIRGTRIHLYLLVETWQQGAPLEYICNYVYSSLNIADAYAAIAYFLRHQDALTEYFRKQDDAADQAMKEYTSRPEYQAEREKLLAFKAEWEQRHAKARE